jgi:hypothetical protein
MSACADWRWGGQEGAFDDAVKGVHAVAHTASPVHIVDDPQGESCIHFLSA